MGILTLRIARPAQIIIPIVRYQKKFTGKNAIM
jgi:hypothetical protein